MAYDRDVILIAPYFVTLTWCSSCYSVLHISDKITISSYVLREREAGASQIAGREARTNFPFFCGWGGGTAFVLAEFMLVVLAALPAV